MLIRLALMCFWLPCLYAELLIIWTLVVNINQLTVGFPTTCSIFWLQFEVLKMWELVFWIYCVEIRWIIMWIQECAPGTIFGWSQTVVVIVKVQRWCIFWRNCRYPFLVPHSELSELLIFSDDYLCFYPKYISCS